MQKTLPKIAALTAIVSIAASGAATAGTGAATSVSAGTDGIGGDLLYKVNAFVTARGGFRYAGFDFSKTIDGVNYDLDIGFTSGLAALDVHPAANGFLISGGAYFGDRNIGLEATPAAPVQIGNQVFTPQEVGVVNGTSDWNDAAPFVGIGFNNGVNAAKRVGFQAMLGVMYIGKPDVNLEATGGLLANDPTFLAELANEEQNLANDLDDIRFYPVASLGLTIRF